MGKVCKPEEPSEEEELLAHEEPTVAELRLRLDRDAYQVRIVQTTIGVIGGAVLGLISLRPSRTWTAPWQWVLAAVIIGGVIGGILAYRTPLWRGALDRWGR